MGRTLPSILMVRYGPPSICLLNVFKKLSDRRLSSPYAPSACSRLDHETGSYVDSESSDGKVRNVRNTEAAYRLYG